MNILNEDRAMRFIAICVALVVLIAASCTGESNKQVKDGPVESADASTTSDNTNESSDSIDANEMVAIPIVETPIYELLEGSWPVKTIELKGEIRASGPGMPENIEISGGVFTVTSEGKVLGTFSNMKMYARPSTSPLQLDLVRDRDGRLEYLPCILELVDHELRIAMPMVPAKRSPDKDLPRPGNFDTTTGQFLVLAAKKDR